MSVKWQFYDPEGATPQTYVWDINPDTFSISAFSKNVSNQANAFGGQIVFEGRPQSREMSFSGTILEESQYQILMIWAQEKRQIRLTDDLSNEYWIYINRFNPERQLKRGHPFYFNYSIEAVVLDWQ